jgi:predicted lipoprotein with Yx(FWY)xxD motif
VPRLSLAALATTAVAIAGCGSSTTTSSSSPAASAPATATATTNAAFIEPLDTVRSLGSTVPSNGDVNPYGIALVPSSIGKLHAGQLLVSNFNDNANNQGTGSTIVQMTSSGKSSPFATVDARSLPGSCPGGVGLTTALGVLPGGYVVVGSLPTTNGKSATAKAGCLIVLDSNGKPLETIASSRIAGPWDMTAVTQGSTTTLFVSNVLEGGAAKGVHTVDNSTVLRIRVHSGVGAPPTVLSERVIADRIPWRDDPAALVIGPTGLALASNGTLYLADTLANRISAIPQALTRTTAASAGGATVSEGGHLMQPLGLALAPNGDILTTNAGDGNIVETTPAGHQLIAQPADPKTGAGSLFGLVVAPGSGGLFFVDDGDNTLRVLHASGAGVTIDSASSAKLGQQVLVDSSGRTLYELSPETAGHLLCTSSECLKIWPPASAASAQAKLGPGAHGSLGVVHRSDGTSQLTLNGLPLYAFSGDHARGEANGQGLESFGGTWHAVSASGSAVAAAPGASSTSTTQSTPAYGY